MIVRGLRAHQFVEDAGPLAHPVRPEVYRENAAVEVKAPTVFVLQSAFGPTHDIEAEAVESPPELPSGESA